MLIGIEAFFNRGTTTCDAIQPLCTGIQPLNRAVDSFAVARGRKCIEDKQLVNRIGKACRSVQVRQKPPKNSSVVHRARGITDLSPA